MLIALAVVAGTVAVTGAFAATRYRGLLPDPPLLAGVAARSHATLAAAPPPNAGAVLPDASSAREEPPPPTPAPTLPPTPGRFLFRSDWLSRHGEADLPEVKGPAAILVDVDTRQVLWERDVHTRRPPASLAKLMTAIVVADDAATLDQPVVVAPEADVKAIQAIEPASTVMGINAGEVLTVRELLTGLFLRSGNDAAEALARGIIPRDRFVEEMNEKALRLGMADSHFTTPVGLDDPNMYSSPYDLAEAAYTIDTRYPQLAAIADQPQMDIPKTATHKAYVGINWLHTYMLKYPGATGMKTGNTDDAGSCVVATATRGDRRLIAVVLHSTEMVGDAEKLLDYGFALPAAA